VLAGLAEQEPQLLQPRIKRILGRHGLCVNGRVGCTIGVGRQSSHLGRSSSNGPSIAPFLIGPIGARPTTSEILLPASRQLRLELLTVDTTRTAHH
jgi:hypothetical protein